jgi:hypothetical protein
VTSVSEWKQAILNKFPNAKFREETGKGETYGEVGDITAYVGNDMQSDVISVYLKSEGTINDFV